MHKISRWGDSSDRSTSRREGETRQGEAGCGLGDCGPGMGVAEAVDGAAGVTAGYQVVWRKYMLLCSARRCEWGGEQQWRRPFHLLRIGGERRQ